MKPIRYTHAAVRDLKSHPDLGPDLRAAIEQVAAGAPRVHPVTRLAHSPARRLRVGEGRLIFEDREADLLVTKIGRRGDVYT